MEKSAFNEIKITPEMIAAVENILERLDDHSSADALIYLGRAIDLAPEIAKAVIAAYLRTERSLSRS